MAAVCFRDFSYFLYDIHVPHHVSVKHLILEVEAHDITLRRTDSFNVNTQDMSQSLYVKNIGNFSLRCYDWRQ